MSILSDYGHLKYNYDKELNLKIFKLKYAHLSNDLDEKLYEEIFGDTFVTLANKLINATSKEENLTLINDIEKNKDKILEQEYSKFVIQPAHKCGDLLNAALEFNETIQLEMI